MATTTITAPVTGATVQTRPDRHLVRTGTVAGLTAAAATSSTAALAHAAGVSLRVSGQAIPLLGFAQVTFVAALVGTVLAAVFARRASHPARTFTRTTIVLTLGSFVPDVIANAPASTRLVLAFTHVVAAVIVIPALASRLTD